MDEIENEIARLFSEVRYWPRGLLFRSASHRRFIKELATRVNNAKICLDLGCGTGRYRPYLQAIGLEWHGADILPNFHLDPDRYKRITDNFLPFSDAHFDVICMFNVIEHFWDPEVMFTEIARCTRMGGLVCGAVAFHEMEHDSYYHLTHKGLQKICERHRLHLTDVFPSEYSGIVLVAQRFFGGNGRIMTESKRSFLASVLLCNLNWLPFVIICALETARKKIFRRFNNQFRDAATFYFFAKRT